MSLLLIPSPAFAHWTEPHISRFGVMTWSPVQADPDFFDGAIAWLESDLFFGDNDFRVSGHARILSGGDHFHFPSYEWEYLLTVEDWALGYAGDALCDLPACANDTPEADESPNNYAVVSARPWLIEPHGAYNVEIPVFRNPARSTTRVQLGSVAGAYSSSCPFYDSSDASLCAFENYHHFYNKVRHHSAPGTYPIYFGTDSKFSTYYMRDASFESCQDVGTYWTASSSTSWSCLIAQTKDNPNYVRMQSIYAGIDGQISQTIPLTVIPGDEFTVEIVAWCPGTVDCPLRTTLWASGGVIVPRMQIGDFSTTLQAGSGYHLCRMDSVHGNPRVPAHDYPRLSLEILSSAVNVDGVATLGFVSYGNTAAAIDQRRCNNVGSAP